MSKIFIRISDEEVKALTQLASVERRSTRDQAALIIRRELERMGLITPPPPLQAQHSAEVTNG
jgi:hypothetical protein